MKLDQKVQGESSTKESFVAEQTKQTPSEDGAAKDGAAIQEALADQELEEEKKKQLADAEKLKGWPEIIPLELEPLPPKLDIKLLPPTGGLRDYVKAASLENEAPPEAVMGFMLSAMGAVTGARFGVRPDSRKQRWVEFPIRSTALVMGVSDGKSNIFRAAMAPIEEVQKKYDKKNAQESRVHKDAEDFYESSRKGKLKAIEKAVIKGVSTEKLKDELSALEEPLPLT